MNNLNLRSVEIFKPYDNEFPEFMLLDAGANEACIEVWAAAATLRVAKIGSAVLGCYAMNRSDTFNFALLGAIVDQPKRHQGLGRWLVGHAIGVAESKGGRHLHTPRVGTSRCLPQIGFRREGTGWVFDLIQE